MTSCCRTPTTPASPAPDRSRRALVQLAAWAGGAGLFALAAPGPARAAGQTEALLLSCMDFRLMDDIERYMSGRGLADKYDHIVLAGASLGALTRKYPAWNRTFWQHLDIAIQLHGIHKVVVMDHRDCGAYKVILGKDFAKDPADETRAHTAELHKLRKAIAKAHPKLEVELLLMSLDGSVEPIA